MNERMIGMDEEENAHFHSLLSQMNCELTNLTMHPNIDPSIGFRIQFFCKRCKLILSPNKLVEGCPKCQENIDLLLV